MGCDRTLGQGNWHAQGSAKLRYGEGSWGTKFANTANLASRLEEHVRFNWGSTPAEEVFRSLLAPRSIRDPFDQKELAAKGAGD